jgi:hypothetical protein
MGLIAHSRQLTTREPRRGRGPRIPGIFITEFTEKRGSKADGLAHVANAKLLPR